MLFFWAMNILPLHHTEYNFSFKDAIRLHNIPAITGHDSISDIERNLSIQLSIHELGKVMAINTMAAAPLKVLDGSNC